MPSHAEVAVLVAVAISVASATAPPSPQNPLDCGFRLLAYKQAVKMQPWSDHTKVFDALELGVMCG
jgi:hypothetical protein